jgi:hypothetical protein
MRKKDINGIINDLLELGNWRHPMEIVWVPKKFETNLITGKTNASGSLKEFYEEKSEWFKKRIKNLGGNLKDFTEAKIIIFGAKEKIKLIYKDEEFVKEKIIGNVKNHNLKKELEEI